MAWNRLFRFTEACHWPHLPSGEGPLLEEYSEQRTERETDKPTSRVSLKARLVGAKAKIFNAKALCEVALLIHDREVPSRNQSPSDNALKGNEGVIAAITCRAS